MMFLAFSLTPSLSLYGEIHGQGRKIHRLRGAHVQHLGTDDKKSRARKEINHVAGRPVAKLKLSA